MQEKRSSASIASASAAPTSAAYLGKMPFVTYPRILGHELGVEVVAVGDGVATSSRAIAVRSSRTSTTRNSYASRRGRPNCCERLQVLGVHIDGGMRPQFIVPARKLHVGNKLCRSSNSPWSRRSPSAAMPSAAAA